jgi:hypothetical protein
MFNASDFEHTFFLDLQNHLRFRNFTGVCRLVTDVQSLEASGVTTIIYRTLRDSGAVRYFPCLNNPTDKPELEMIDLPDTGINILIPITETVCHPELRR